MILGVPPRPGLGIMMASKPVDFRKYAANIIMWSRREKGQVIVLLCLYRLRITEAVSGN